MKTVVSYAYFETNRSMYNFDFFVQTGVTNDPNILFIFVINGHNCAVQLPTYDNCVILKRDNIGFDFGAHRASIDYLTETYKCAVQDIPFDYFICMNCGVIGPFLPAFYPKNLSWTNIFTDKLNDKIKLVGSSLVCFEYKAMTGRGPHVEGFCFCLDKIGLTIVFNKKTIFISHLTKENAINNGEYGLSKAILEAGYSIDCLLYKYQNIDWSNQRNWINQNNNTFPSRSGSYDGITIHPFEVVFHKWFWLNSLPVNFNYVVKYRKWKLNEIIKNKKIHASYGIGEYMINITDIVTQKFVNNNKIIIPVKYNTHNGLKAIARVLGSGQCQLNIHIDNVLYTIPHVINDPVELLIENEYDISAFYGCDKFKIDVTNKFINTFIKCDKIMIARQYKFNECFEDACPGMYKSLYLRVGDEEYAINEHNFVDIELDAVKK